MIRGTTAYFKFALPYNYDQLESANIVFWQPYNDGPTPDRPLPITKILKQCVKTAEKELSVSLTPEETLRFTDTLKAYVQMTATTIDGIRFGSYEKTITVYPVRNDNVEDEAIPTPDYDGVVILDGEYI